ncbi:hypothetical protein [Youngiibacter fragilis]|nr:hypothetical protein [Youngiibacter fragilis]
MKRIATASLILLLLGLAACRREPSDPTIPSATVAPSATQETTAPAEPEVPEAPDEWKPGTETLEKIPYESRRFVMSNGIEIRRIEETSKLDGTDIMVNKDSLSGFKSSQIEKKINTEIGNTLIEIMDQVKAEALGSGGNEGQKVTGINISTNVIYSCANVLFIDYYAYAEYPEANGISYVQKFRSVGFDLTTGEKLELADLFRNDFNHEKYLNEKIIMYIIENNFDDPDSGFLSGPFKGIREDQSFSFDLSGVRIILDEKNDEFMSLDYPLSIIIPLNEIGDDLAIFERYMSSGNLFHKEGLRKLLPNVVEYIPESVFQDFGATYAISIINGKFYGISDKGILDRLNELATSRLDHEGFIERAKAHEKTDPAGYYGSMNHDVQVIMNKGGYLCVVFMDLSYEQGNEKVSRIFVNIDLTTGKDMLLKDIFIDGFDYTGKILDTAGLNRDQASVQDNEFYFDENGIYVNILQNDVNLGVLNLWIPYEDLGFENIAIYNK